MARGKMGHRAKKKIRRRGEILDKILKDKGQRRHARRKGGPSYQLMMQQQRGLTW